MVDSSVYILSYRIVYSLLKSHWTFPTTAGRYNCYYPSCFTQEKTKAQKDQSSFISQIYINLELERFKTLSA